MEKEHLLTHEPSEQLSLEIRGVGEVQGPVWENQVEKLALDLFVFKHLKKANEKLAVMAGNRPSIWLLCRVAGTGRSPT